MYFAACSFLSRNGNGDCRAMLQANFELYISIYRWGRVCAGYNNNCMQSGQVGPRNPGMTRGGSMKRHKEIPSRRTVKFRVCLPLQWKYPFILERDATAEGDHAGFEIAISRPGDAYTVCSNSIPYEIGQTFKEMSESRGYTFLNKMCGVDGLSEVIRAR